MKVTAKACARLRSPEGGALLFLITVVVQVECEVRKSPSIARSFYS